MKTMRKIATLMLALALILSLAAPVFAAEDTYSITINNSVDGHTYEAYQIFTGEIAKNAENDAAEGTNAVLSNVQWGANAKYEGEVSEDVLDGLSIEEAISYVDFSTDPIATSTDKGDTYVIEGLAPGYYLIKDKDNSVSGNDAYTTYIIEVVEDSTVAAKSDVPEVEKKVKDTNDSTGETTGWQDSADYDIGDKVPFQLTATLADNVSDYDTYKIVFHDTLSEGLTYNNDAVVTFEGQDVTEYFTISYENGKLTVSCDNVKAFGAGNSDKIVVTYTATLNDKAVLGAEGNPNEVYLEFSNNPNWNPETDEGDEPTGETPKDKVIVFTFKVIVNKVDENGAPLEGAGFTLYKKNAEGEYVAVGEEMFGDDLTTFEWAGLDDGDYKLVETTTPAGYNTIEDIEFTITAEHDELSDDPQLTKLEGGDMFTGDVTTGALTADVENKAGITLPETGGIGTTIFYVLGCIMVLGAAVLLVTKKRMAA